MDDEPLAVSRGLQYRFISLKVNFGWVQIRSFSFGAYILSAQKWTRLRINYTECVVTEPGLMEKHRNLLTNKHNKN